MLVLDPSRNLAGARRAGERIASKLGARARVLEGEGARRWALIEAISEAFPLHAGLSQYDGHAVFGGKDGVDAALTLADGVLTARELRAPAVVAKVPLPVVLSGCETGREEGLGVAHAFLQRGARQVLAATAVVDDRSPRSSWRRSTTKHGSTLALGRVSRRRLRCAAMGLSDGAGAGPRPNSFRAPVPQKTESSQPRQKSAQSPSAAASVRGDSSCGHGRREQEERVILLGGQFLDSMIVVGVPLGFRLCLVSWSGGQDGRYRHPRDD